MEARDGIEPSCQSALQAAARASENRARALPPGVEPSKPSFGGTQQIRYRKHGARGEIRTPTAEAATLQAACLASEQPALGVADESRTRIFRAHNPALWAIELQPPSIRKDSNPRTAACRAAALPLSY
jgi:hypothetical protein